MKKILPVKLLLIGATVLSSVQMTSQTSCPFTGLNASYCSNGSTVSLTPGTPGGSFSGPGVNAAGVFTPSLATIGTNTINYNYCSTAYTVQAGTFAPVLSATAGATAVSGDDVVSGALQIGFNFRFYCNTYTQFYASSNGFITFTNGGGAGCCQGLTMPSAAPNNMIAACWTDLNTGLTPTGSSITYTTIGSAPNRQLIVSYNAVPHHNSGNGGFPVTVQVIMYETTNIIEIHSTSIPISTGAVVYNHTQGIQNAGTLATPVPGRNGAVWAATNDMYQFIPGPYCSDTQTTSVSSASLTVSGNSAPLCSGSSATLVANNNTTYTWTTPSGVSSTSNIVVSPTLNTTYTVAATNSVNCISNALVTVTVNNVPVITPTSNPASGTVCLGGTVIVGGTGVNTYTLANANVTNNVAFSPTATAIYTVNGTNACGTTSAAITITVTPLPVFASASSTLVCSGTPATLTAGGATSYTWTSFLGTNNGTTYVTSPSANTTYSIVGKTGNCIGNSTILISTKSNPTLNIVASSSAVCSGNPVNLSVVGNATAYVWSTGQSGTSISPSPTQLTLYTVTGTNTNNCSTQANQVILVNPNPTITVNVPTPVVCSGGASTLTAGGAATYSWTTNDNTASTVVHPTANASYTVTGSYTTGCNSNAVATVSVFIPSISVSGNTATCLGSNINISASGADTYTWANNGAPSQGITVSPAANTIYTVTGSVGDQISGVSCNATNTLEVTVNPLPVLTATSNRTINTICRGESAILTGTGAGVTATYTWTGGAGAVVASTNTVSPIADQNYTITGTDNNGCKGSVSIQILVATCAGIQSVSKNTTGLLVYPNPSNGEFTITADQAITLQIIDELGQQVRTITLNGNSAAVKVNNLANGVYFIMGSNGNGSVKEKIVITH